MSRQIDKNLQRLDEQLAGHLSRPGDPRYRTATDIWARQLDRIPQAVAHCRNATDVQAVIRTARDCGLPLSVRGGGHDWVGRSLCNGLVVDLSGMNGVVTGPDNRLARVQGGARAGDVTALTDPLRVTPVLGQINAVGVAGLALGGGYGPLIGSFGLALDNLVAAEVVLADGRIVLANQQDNADLFWALRGGGGNFGAVTTLHLRLHDMPSLHAGVLLFPFAEAASVLGSCADYAAGAADELNIQVGFMAGPDGAPILFLAPTWSGEPAQGEAAIAPLTKFGTPVNTDIGKRPYGELLGMFSSFVVNGRGVYIDTSLLPRLDGGAIDILVAAMKQAPSPGCAIVTHDFRGAASRVAADATAFGLRRDHVLVEIIAIFADRSDAEAAFRHRQWAETTRKALAPIALPGAYANMMNSGDTERARRSYGANGPRLMGIKRRYDPDNIFNSAIPLPSG
jgi:FAD/FMN-containing dehydrogenase